MSRYNHVLVPKNPTKVETKLEMSNRDLIPGDDPLFIPHPSSVYKVVLDLINLPASVVPFL